ncbi:hypothetical protein B0H17DRAFT_1137128 [Mycena rosella]|uniref:Uncharacterized protein n=1 Tax=Mycena rosella TaxID=1033263 RepID=A0AAD7GB66_MYCRO|nr:hypothetical protein B0H17DRAFT_1137128 [Mycena rosella]
MRMSIVLCCKRKDSPEGEPGTARTIRSAVGPGSEQQRTVKLAVEGGWLDSSNEELLVHGEEAEEFVNLSINVHDHSGEVLVRELGEDQERAAERLSGAVVKGAYLAMTSWDGEDPKKRQLGEEDGGKERKECMASSTFGFACFDHAVWDCSGNGAECWENVRGPVLPAALVVGRGGRGEAPHLALARVGDARVAAEGPRRGGPRGGGERERDAALLQGLRLRWGWGRGGIEPEAVSRRGAVKEKVARAGGALALEGSQRGRGRGRGRPTPCCRYQRTQETGAGRGDSSQVRDRWREGG